MGISVDFAHRSVDFRGIWPTDCGPFSGHYGAILGAFLWEFWGFLGILPTDLGILPTDFGIFRGFCPQSGWPFSGPLVAFSGVFRRVFGGISPLLGRIMLLGLLQYVPGKFFRGYGIILG